VTDLNAHGISVTLPAGWEGRVFRRPAAGEVTAAADGPPAPAGETTHAVVQVSTIALPPDAGDFASGAVDRLGTEDALVVLFEYDPASVSKPMFSAVGVPRAMAADDFSPNVLQRTIRGQAGAQQFFQEGGRAFCLYVVLGSFPNRQRLVGGVNQVLASISVDGGKTAAPSNAPHSILEVVAGQADLTTLTSLLQTGPASDLLAGSGLAGPGPFTLFAPDDDAFATIDLGILERDPDRLARTLEHHVLTQQLSLDALRRLAKVVPVEGDDLTLAITADAHVTVDGAPIVRPDLDASNGVVHVITGVLELPR
jgi:uncharacterized surface protein with fasciclin (FAS1) repeats